MVDVVLSETMKQLGCEANRAGRTALVHVPAIRVEPIVEGPHVHLGVNDVLKARADFSL
jgi:hypothetical protein